jgi:hypothetical protein
MEKVYEMVELGAGVGTRSAHGFCFALRGLGFRRVRPRILEAPQASEIGGVDGYRCPRTYRNRR